MKTDRYTSIPGWHISLEDFLRLVNRPTPAMLVRNALEAISDQAPWFDPQGVDLSNVPHPIFRLEEPAE